MLFSFVRVLHLASWLAAVQGGQVHVAFSEDPSRLAITWVTLEPQTDPHVVWEGATVLPAHDTFPGDDRWFHHVLTPELEPGHSYSFEVSGDPEKYELTHPDSRKAEKEGFSMVWVADMGASDAGNGVRNLLAKLLPSVDFVVHGGDIAYGDYPDVDYNEEYDKWGEKITKISSAKPYMVNPGNHDMTCDHDNDPGCHPNTQNFTYFRTRFRMPQRTSAGNMWYSFDHGNVHFVSLNTETDFPDAPAGRRKGKPDPKTGPFGDQLAWLEADLQSNDKPWTIVYGHRPLYSSKEGGDSVDAAFEPILRKHGVDLYIAGHIHGYERVMPNGEDRVIPAIMNGVGGSFEGTYSAEECAELFGNPKAEVSKWTIWGVSLFKWTDPSTLEVTFVSDAGEELDRLVLRK